MDAEELLRRYGAGERDFRGIILYRADLGGAELHSVDLSGARLININLEGAFLELDLYPSPRNVNWGDTEL